MTCLSNDEPRLSAMPLATLFSHMAGVISASCNFSQLASGSSFIHCVIILCLGLPSRSHSLSRVEDRPSCSPKSLQLVTSTMASITLRRLNFFLAAYNSKQLNKKSGWCRQSAAISMYQQGNGFSLKLCSPCSRQRLQPISKIFGVFP